MNPNFKFYPTIYTGCPSSSLLPEVDGVFLYPEFYWRVQSQPDVSVWTKAITSCIRLYPNDTIIGVYAWLSDYVTAYAARAKLVLAYKLNPRGVMTFALPWDGPTWYVVSTLYRQWSGTSVITATASGRDCKASTC